MSGKQRLSARDYKHAGRRSNGLPLHYRAFAIGLGIGLMVALAVYVVMQRAAPVAAEVKPQPRAKAKADDPAAETTDPPTQYDFYDMLPKFEVVVPEKEHDARRDTTSAPVEQPGAYVLQVGSYRNQADAERVSGQLAKQGIEATVQRVAVDADVWHRVRIGPFRDLDRLNATRKQLRAAGIDVMMLRVGD